ncbi:hypothetical protein jhhlp_004965, partial [Lomentospora prolificans]
ADDCTVQKYSSEIRLCTRDAVAEDRHVLDTSVTQPQAVHPLLTSVFSITMADQNSRPLCHIVAPVGNMGYGFHEEQTERELARLVPTGIPTAIILDSGSTDSGPEKLALGTMTCPESAYFKDLAKLLRLVHTYRVPLIFGSAGGDGSDEHVRLMGQIIQEIVTDNPEYCFKAISIFSSIDKSIILERLRAGKITGCGTCVPNLTEADVDNSPRIVAQIGPEPFLDAMEADPDFNVIIGGRAYDPAPYVAYCLFQLRRQYPDITHEKVQARYGGFLHMGKIMECGGLCSTPKSHGAVSTIYPSGIFEVRPTDPESRCTPYSVAAHALYENTRPDILQGPGGALHLEESKYEQLDDGRTVRVCGSQFKSLKSQGLSYQFKLEAARVVGFRTIFLGSVRDYILIEQIDKLLVAVKKYVASQHPDSSGEWDLDFHLYGKGQHTSDGPGEIFIVAEAIAPTQTLATSIASKARVGMIHGPYPGQKATAGNFAFGIGGKLEIETGPCAKFSVYHLMGLEQGEERLLSPDGSAAGQLIKSSVAVVGNGQRLPSDEAFRASIAKRQELLSQPSLPARKSPSTKPSSLPDTPKTLSDLTHVMRSKNAGPYEITIDAIFVSEKAYHAVKSSGLLSPENIARALCIPKEDIIWSGFMDPALAFKVTIPRVRGGKRTAAGSFMENDVHGSQQHLGLANLKLHPEIVSTLTPLAASAASWYTLLPIFAAFLSVSSFVAARRLLSR